MAGTNSTVEVIAPLPVSTLKDYARDIFAPIRRGECVTTVWPLMAGRRVRNKFIISYPQLFAEELGDPNKYLLAYIEPLELTEESGAGYIKLISRSILESCKALGIEIDNEESFTSATDYPSLIDKLSELIKIISQQNRETVLFIGEFDELTFADQVLYNNLKSLWRKSAGSLHYIFMVLEDLTQPDNLSKFGELNELLLTNIVYVPLSSDEDVEYIIERLGKEFNRSYSAEEVDLLKEICGGHPFLLRSCARLIALMNGDRLPLPELKKMLISHFEPRSASQKIFNFLKDEDKEMLQRIVDEKIVDLPPSAINLVKLGLIKKLNDEYWVPFGEIFASVITNVQPVTAPHAVANQTLAFELKSGSIFLESKSIEDKFTRQEYEILRFLLGDPDRVHSRDEIGEAMWGKQSYEKYSDWAIDQVMSKIRKKLKNLGAGDVLVTVRGRGYKLSV